MGRTPCVSLSVYADFGGRKTMCLVGGHVMYLLLVVGGSSFVTSGAAGPTAMIGRDVGAPPRVVAGPACTWNSNNVKQAADCFANAL